MKKGSNAAIHSYRAHIGTRLSPVAGAAAAAAAAVVV